MIDKQENVIFNRPENDLFNKLIAERQFVTVKERAVIEARLLETELFNIKEKYAEDFSFTIELTKSCNMTCSYCYMRNRIEKDTFITKSHVDAIYSFYEAYTDDHSKIAATPIITVTGGEPLIDEATVELINYITLKWPMTKLSIYTNGVNLLKFYDRLPLRFIKDIHVSLDGIRDIHLHRRYLDKDVNGKIYDNIVTGVRRLLNDGIAVKIKTTLDRNSYHRHHEFADFLKKTKISTSELYSHGYGAVLDYADPLDLDINFNNKQDVMDMQSCIAKIDANVASAPLFLSSAILYKALRRNKNEPFIPRHQRCDSRLLSYYRFSCDGNVYFCDCVQDDGSDAIGTYYPHISIDESAVDRLLKRSVLNNNECQKCVYKFICLGGCPLSAKGQGTEMSCGIYADDEILDNLEFDYQ